MNVTGSGGAGAELGAELPAEPDISSSAVECSAIPIALRTPAPTLPKAFPHPLGGAGGVGLFWSDDHLPKAEKGIDGHEAFHRALIPWAGPAPGGFGGVGWDDLDLFGTGPSTADGWAQRRTKFVPLVSAVTS